ncbi:MAG TPA: glycosyltransferase family 4 protein, partial [Gammaproteobacteria bacterium]|nr:glycosyltransferase family 4 protein [Gammaproteobacteria bacterium]
MMLAASIFVATLVLSASLTGLVRRYALDRNLVDRPSARGLHATPVARGGGAAILVVVSACLVALTTGGWLEPRLGVSWTVCGLGFGLLGWVDDHVDLSAAVRFLCQLALAVLFCVTLRTASPLPFQDLLLVVSGSVAMVWMVNLFNFMDGSDGFAALEALLVAGGGAAIVSIGGTADTAPIALLVAGASAGFLWWNWQPARIFMGDVGSYFLGFQFAALILQGATNGSGAPVWLILLAPFITDATLTLLRRIVTREKWWEAHRTHLYQRLIMNGWSHARVCFALLAITAVILAPAAVVAVRIPSFAPGATVAVYLLTAIIWVAVTLRIR